MKKFINDSLVWIVRGIKGFSFEVRLASEEVKTLMKLNASNVDVAALKALKATRPDGISAEDVKNVLYVGKTLRVPFPAPEVDPENPKGGIPCSTCGAFFDAITYTNKEGARRGSVTELKSELFDQMVKDSKDESLPVQNREAAARFLKASDNLGAIMMKGRVLHNVKFFGTCPSDVREERKPKVVLDENGKPVRDEKGKVVKEGTYFTYLTLADALAQATVHDARIAGGKSRSYVNGLKKGLTNFRRPGENRGDNRRGDNFNRGQRRQDDRPRSDFHGASFLDNTTVVLVAAEKSGKLNGGLRQLAEASNDFLKTLGIEGSERAFDAVRTIASKTLERQQATAESKPASSVDKPTTPVATFGDVAGSSLSGLKFKPAKKAPRRGKNSGPRQSKADRIGN